MNKELSWEKTGINFIMFPVNPLVSWYYTVILGRACVPHLSKALCKRNNCASSIQNNFPTTTTSHVHILLRPSDPSCFKCCSNSSVNILYVNCIMPRKQEAKMRNRQNLSLLLPLGLICHCFSSNDDTRWQQAGWYHLSSRATKGARVYNMWLLWWTTAGAPATIFQCVQLMRRKAWYETSEQSHLHSESAASSSLSLWCEGLSEAMLMFINHSFFKNIAFHKS